LSSSHRDPSSSLMDLEMDGASSLATEQREDDGPETNEDPETGSRGSRRARVAPVTGGEDGASAAAAGGSASVGEPAQAPSRGTTTARVDVLAFLM